MPRYNTWHAFVDGYTSTVDIYVCGLVGVIGDRITSRIEGDIPVYFRVEVEKPTWNAMYRIIKEILVDINAKKWTAITWDDKLEGFKPESHEIIAPPGEQAHLHDKLSCMNTHDLDLIIQQAKEMFTCHDPHHGLRPNQGP